MIDFTSWYFVLKHFKLKQFNIISFFLFFVQSDPDVFHLTLTTSDIGIKEIFENKANIAQLSKKRKPLISGDFFFAPMVFVNWRENLRANFNLNKFEKLIYKPNL